MRVQVQSLPNTLDSFPFLNADVTLKILTQQTELTNKILRPNLRERWTQGLKLLGSSGRGEKMWSPFREDRTKKNTSGKALD